VARAFHLKGISLKVPPGIFIAVRFPLMDELFAGDTFGPWRLRFPLKLDLLKFLLDFGIAAGLPLITELLAGDITVLAIRTLRAERVMRKVGSTAAVTVMTLSAPANTVTLAPGFYIPVH
jgi:hypothetical protein